MIAPKNVAKARKAIVVRPVTPPSTSGRNKLAASMRRLGADDATVAKLLGPGASASASG